MDTATRLDRRLRARDLDDLPHEWDTRYELIGGVLHMSKHPSFEHQEFLGRLLIRIGPAVLEAGGHIVPEPGLVWDDEGEDNVVPDLAILLRVPSPPRRQKLRACPDIVVEVLSEGEINRTPVTSWTSATSICAPARSSTGSSTWRRGRCCASPAPVTSGRSSG